MQYRRDVPRADQDAIASEIEHVRDHLASVADADDDPTIRRDDVQVEVLGHVDGDRSLVSVVGYLDAEPDAPYLKPDFDPTAEEPITFVPWGDYDEAAYAEFMAGRQQ